MHRRTVLPAHPIAILRATLAAVAIAPMIVACSGAPPAAEGGVETEDDELVWRGFKPRAEAECERHLTC